MLFNICALFVPVRVTFNAYLHCVRYFILLYSFGNKFNFKVCRSDAFTISFLYTQNVPPEYVLIVWYYIHCQKQ